MWASHPATLPPMNIEDRTVDVVVKNIAIGVGGLGSIPGRVKSHTVPSTARHRCEVSSEMCYPSAKPWRLAPLLVTRFGVMLRG